MVTQRTNMTLMGVFAALALLLAAIGIFGVIAYMVSRRSLEIGIRMALGAQRRDVLRMVLGHGMILALAGIVIGLGGALAATRAMRTLLFEVSPSDPWTLAAARPIRRRRCRSLLHPCAPRRARRPDDDSASRLIVFHAH